MNKRFSIVDLWKFIASIMIMYHHLFHLGHPFNGKFHGEFTWIYVEFFYILTGYFTYKHFYKLQISQKKMDICKQSLRYTLNKFVPFLPYTTIAISLQYLITSPMTSLFNNPKLFFGHFYNYPFEIFLIGDAVKMNQLVIPIWFLSAMLLVFPAVTLICQIRNKYLVLMISGLYPLFYFGQISFGSRTWPNDIFRALGGMLLGICVYIIADLIKTKKVKTGQVSFKFSILLTVIELGGMLFTVAVTVLNVQELDKVIVCIFAVCIGIMLSGYSLTSRINSNFISYLGKISLPIYIFHWTVGTAINKVNEIIALSIPVKLTAYFAGTIIVAIALYSLITMIKKRRLKLNPIL